MSISTKAARALILLGLLATLTIRGAQAQDPEQPTQAKINEVFELAKHHPDVNLRGAAVEWLLAVGEPAIPGFVIALTESMPFERLDRRLALSCLGAPAVPPVIELLDKDDRELVLNAVKILREIGPASAPATPKLAKLLKHEDYGVREEAIKTLGKIGPGAAEAVPALAAALSTESVNPKKDIVIALGMVKAKPEVAVPALVKQLSDSALVDCVAETLAVYGPDAVEAVPALLRVWQVSPRTDAKNWMSISVLRAIYSAKPDAMPESPEFDKTKVARSLATDLPGIHFDEYAHEKLPVLDLQTATDELEEQRSLVAGFREEATPSAGKLAPGGIEWKVVRKQVPSDGIGDRAYEYSLEIAGDGQRIELVSGYEAFDPLEDYSDQPLKDSFRVDFVRSPDLISVGWDYVAMPGSGHFTDASGILFLKTASGWKNIYETRYEIFSRGGPEDYGYGSEKYEWDAQKSILKIRQENGSEETSSEPLPLSQVTQEEGGKLYTQEVSVTAERLFQIKDEALEYLGGKRIIEPGPGTFKLADIPVYLDNDKADPAKTIAKIRKLNPKLGKSEEFQGALVLETGIPAKDKDE